MPDNVPKGRPLRLTKEQQSILTLLLQGFSTNEEIAGELSISVYKVERERTKIMERFRAATIIQAVAICIKRGLLNLDDIEVEP